LPSFLANQNFWLRSGYYYIPVLYFAKYRTGTAVLFEKSTKYRHRGTF